MAEANNGIKDFKAPPTLGKDSLYVNWKKKLKFGRHLHLSPKKTRLCYFHDIDMGKAREEILKMDIKKLTEKTSVNNLMVELDKMYLEDESSQAYEAYETFEKFVRPSGMSISYYVIQHEQLHFKAKSFHMTILDGVWAYRLFNSTNLTNKLRQLIKATVSENGLSNYERPIKKGL